MPEVEIRRAQRQLEGEGQRALMKALLQLSVNAIPPTMRGWIRHIPVLAETQRWLVNRVLSGQSFVHTINAGPAAGLCVEITLPTDKAIWAGIFEPEFSAALRSGVRRGDICYDIGGYRGYMSGIMALAGAAQVVTCEPLPDNVAALQRLAKLNPMLPLRIEQVAIGASDGDVQFGIMPDRSMGKLATSTFQVGSEIKTSMVVKLQRLDTLVFDDGLPRPDVVKIDVEGAELDVLNGAKRTLAESRARVFLEAHSKTLDEECRQLLADLDYRVRQLERDLSGPDDQPRHLVAEPL